MLTHQRPARSPRFVQASQQAMIATWLEDPFWYYTHYIFVPGSRGQVLPCVKGSGRDCRWCREAEVDPYGCCKPRSLHAASAGSVQLVTIAPPIAKSHAQLIDEFRRLPAELRKPYGYGSNIYTPRLSDENLRDAALKYAHDKGTAFRHVEPQVQDTATVQIVELLSAVGDQVQIVIGDGVRWRGKKTSLRPVRRQSGLETTVQLVGEADDVPDNFQGAVAFLDELWAKHRIKALDAR